MSRLRPAETKSCRDRDFIKSLDNHWERLTIPVVNNVAGRPVQNVGGSLAQGDPPSMNWFAIGIEPLLHFLDRRLSGILMSSLPTSGPCLQNGIKPEPLQERYKVIGYADDIKPSVWESSLSSTKQQLYLKEVLAVYCTETPKLVNAGCYPWAGGEMSSSRKTLDILI